MPASHSMTGNICGSGANRVTVPLSLPCSRHGTTGGNGSSGLVVVQTPEVGRPDVHAGPAANGLEALQDLNVLRAVRTAALVRVSGRRFSHCHGYDFPALVRSS